ncbi:MAG: alpha/beta fold hydrolase [Myxococcales bacterium]|nr:alpha/beta fold hydrolase [Myxococcales bacterium]
MQREQVVNSALMPIDWALGKSIEGLERAGVLERASDLVYNGLAAAMRTQFKLANELTVCGAENVPTQGGVLLAPNHQSWLDVQVIGAASPRRLHFIAKSELGQWPVLRHLIKLSESVFVKRGGDNDALAQIADALRNGWALVIFPEGTIPGEENVPRRAVDPRTGLLPGHTGVVRLAIEAGVPIVPVGLSGTGRAFPPEAYPRLEMLRMPASTPIRIRFGEPIYLDEYRGRDLSRGDYRALTDDVMHKISALVDHRANYAPIEVPIPEPPKHERLGVLVLHGFTSDVATVDGLLPHLEAAGIPYARPVLRGHGTHYQDLCGVTAADWYIDAEYALIDLLNRCDRVVVVGLSMGGLVALELAMRHPEWISGVVTVAAALKFADPLARLTGLISPLVKYWPSPESFNDKSLATACKNYSKFPTKTFASLYGYAQHIAARLREVHVPIRVLQSKKDQIVAPEAANIIYQHVSSPLREIYWYEQSGHEMMQDLEADKVFADIMDFVERFHARPAADEANVTLTAAS